jgi:hypothetical protein
VARSADGGLALAAIGIGMSLLVVVNTPALAMAPLVTLELGRRDERRLFRYAVAVGAAGSLAVLALAIPPGSGLVRALFGLDADLGAAVSAFLFGLALNSLGVAIRRYQHGRLIHYGVHRPDRLGDRCPPGRHDRDRRRRYRHVSAARALRGRRGADCGRVH